MYNKSNLLIKKLVIIVNGREIKEKWI